MLDLIERETPLKGWMSDYEFILVQSIEQLKDIVDGCIAAPYCAFDLESTGLDTRIFDGESVDKVVGYSIAYESDKCYYIPVRHKVETERGRNLPLKETNEQIQRLMNEAVIVGHNWLKFDAEMMLASDGITIKNFKPGEVITYHDSYVLARLAGFKPAGLKPMSKKLLNKEMIDIKEVVTNAKDVDYASVSPYEGLVYAASDAICTKEIFEHPEVQAPIKEQAFIYNLERRILYVVRNMERNKIKLAKEFCQELEDDLLSKIDSIQNSMYAKVAEKTQGKISQFKLDSPIDVSHIFFDIFDMNPKPEKGKNGAYQTNDDVLEKLAPSYELAKLMQEYRTLTKFHRTYIKNMLTNVDKDGYLKFQFSSLQTDSGRFASPGGGRNGDGCSGVNIQAIPARYDKSKPNVRKCLSCDDDEVFVAMDWAGVELRVGTNMSKEPLWLDRFLKGDGDLHTSTASIIYDKPELDIEKTERQVGKCVHPASLLYVNGEYIRIEDIHEGRDKDTFYEIGHKKLNVLTNENQSKPIKQFYSNGVADTLLVCTRRGLTACSRNHRFELEDGTLVKAENLEKGMTLKEIPFGIEATSPKESINFNPFLKYELENDTFQINLNEHVGYFSGLFLGDGATSSNGSYIVCGNHGKYLDWQKTVRESLNKIGLDCSVTKEIVYKDDIDESKKRTGANLYLGSRHTNNVLNKLELVKDSKKIMRVPSFILNGTQELKMSFLAGLLDADGTVSEDNSLTFTQKDWVFIQDCCVLLASLGIHYSVDTRFNETYNRYYFRVRIAKAFNLKFKEYMKCFWKVERLEDPKFKYSKYPKNEVKDIIVLDQEHLLDIGVDSDEHMYLVNNHRTHNTFNFQSLYGGGPGALASTIGIDLQDAQQKQQKFFGRLTTLKKYIRSLQVTARSNKYCVTRFGRRRSLLEEYNSDLSGVRKGADRKAVNTPVQGTAADLMKIAMVKIDDWIQENNLQDIVKMTITMHDEICFRIKKEHVDIVTEIEEIMTLKSTLEKIKWEVPLAVDVEIGNSWDIDYEYPDMVDYCKDKFNSDKVSVIYEKDKNYDEIMSDFKKWMEAKKEAKKEKQEQEKISNASITLNQKAKDDFKSMGTSLLQKENSKVEIIENNYELKSEEDKELIELDENKVSEIEFSEEKSASAAHKIDGAFSILKNAKLSDLPLEAHEKLKKNFYQEEFERLLSGRPSTEDEGVEMPIVVHSPIDDAKKNTIGFIIDSCPGRGKVKFVTSDKVELHDGWINVDILKVTVMSKIYNL